MNYQNHLDTHFLQLKFQKVCRQIEALLRQAKTGCFQKLTSLMKRRERYAKQLLLQASPAMKAGSVLLVASALSLTVQAQTCKTYTNADAANPVRRAGLPQNLWQPVFVDIDGDGDLDCYETSPNQEDGGTQYVKVTFLRNTGSAQLPYYEMDTANTFPKTPGTRAPFNSTVTRLRFVDIDGDGDYDCFAGDYYYGLGGTSPKIQYFKNTGTAKKAKFVKAPDENPLTGIRGSYSLQFSFADFDADGDYDLLTTDLYRSKIFKNVGTVTTPQFTLQQTSYAFFYPTLSVYDYNKDGRTDIMNGYSGGVAYFRNVGAKGQFKFVEDKNLGPLSMPANFVTFGLTDLNNDGVAESYSEDGHYAVSTPVASITSTAAAGSAVTLHANPSNASYTYQWYKGGKKISGATRADYTATTAGRYVVEIKNSCGTGTSLPYVVAANVTDQKSVIAFTNTTSASPLVSAYPNPFTSHFSLNPGSGYSANTIVKITDVQGRIISTTKANNTIMQLGSDLQKGIYIVQVIQDGVVVFMQKIIKQ